LISRCLGPGTTNFLMPEQSISQTIMSVKTGTVGCVFNAAELEKDSLNAVIDKHKQEIVEMQRQAVEQEKERQAELVKLRLEVRL